MTENDGGTPRDPQPETPPTQPLPERPLGAEQPLSAEQPPADGPEPVEAAGSPAGQPEAAASYGQTESAPYAQQPSAQQASYAQQPYPEQSYPQQAATPYGQPGAQTAQYGYGATPPKNDLAVWSLITGILSYVACPLLLGIAAIVLGTMGRRAADEGLADNRGMATAGLILGWVNVALSLLGIVFFVFALALGLLAGGIGTLSDMNDMTY